MNTLAEYFDAFLELVSRGECKRAAARDGDGNIVSVASPRAACFCPMGAALRVTRGEPDGDRLHGQIMRALESQMPSRYVAICTWNDDHTHAEVIEMCERARVWGLAVEALADERHWLILEAPRALAIMDGEDEPILFGDELLQEAAVS